MIGGNWHEGKVKQCGYSVELFFTNFLMGVLLSVLSSLIYKVANTGILCSCIMILVIV